MNRELKPNEKVIGVTNLKRDSYGDEIDYYVVKKDFKDTLGTIIMVEPTVPSSDYESNLTLKKIIEVIDKGITEMEGVYVLYDKEDERKIKRAIEPVFICTLNLKQYYEAVAERRRKRDLERILNSSVKALEKISKFKTVSELDPSMKEYFEEYMGIIAKENGNLLSSGKSNSNEEISETPESLE